MDIIKMSNMEFYTQQRIIKKIISTGLELIVDIDSDYLKLKKNRCRFIEILELAKEHLGNIERNISQKLNSDYKIIMRSLNIIEKLDVFEYIKDYISDELDFECIENYFKLYRVGFILNDSYPYDFYDFDDFEENIEEYEYCTLQAKIISKVIIAIKQINRIIDEDNNSYRENLLRDFENKLEEYKNIFLDYGLDLGEQEFTADELISEKDFTGDKRKIIYLIKTKVEGQILKIKQLINLNLSEFSLIEGLEEIIDTIDIEELVLRILEDNNIEADYDQLNAYEKKKKKDCERNKMNRREINGKTQKQNERFKKIEEAKEYKRKGFTEDYIAEKLNVSKKTVKRYLSMDKKCSQ